MSGAQPDGPGQASYARAGVDIAAGERAVDLIRASVARTAGPEVLGGPEDDDEELHEYAECRHDDQDDQRVPEDQRHDAEEDEAGEEEAVA